MSISGTTLFIAVWEFQARRDKYGEFENAYGPDGDWAQLFRRGHGYIRTELHSDPKMPGRYFTLDIWQSKQGFEDFKRTRAAEYAALDARCESLTEAESLVGECATPEQVRALLSSKGLDVAQSGREIRFRSATLSDIQAMLVLEKQLPNAAHWSEPAYEQIFDPGAPPRIAWVAIKEAGILCGFVIGRIGSGECELENIVVAEADQRSGIGKKLLDALIDSARDKKAVRVLLEVRESNHAARSFYEHYGFAVSSRRKNYYSAPDEDALIYVFPL